MTFARPPRPVPNDMVKMTDRGLRLRQAGVTYRLLFLRLIAQFFAQIYMNCFVSSQVEQIG